MNKNSRKEHLLSLRDEVRTMIFYEAPHKLPATLCDMLEALGDREIAIVRELTKIHEEVIKTTLSEAAKRYSEENIKGEIVLIIRGAEVKKEEYTVDEALEIAREQIEKGLSLNESAKYAAKVTGMKKNIIYKEWQERE